MVRTTISKIVCVGSTPTRRTKKDSKNLVDGIGKSDIVISRLVE